MSGATRAQPTSRPLVSVCTPVYNGAATLAATMASVCAQTLDDWELVITDDGSTDNSMAVAESFRDPRIRILRNPDRLGACGNWNRCVNEARGRYIKVLCHDDLIAPECLARQAAVLADPGAAGVSLVAGARRIINESDRVLMVRRWRREDFRMKGHEAIRRTFRAGTNLIGEPSAAMFRRSDWERVGPFAPYTYAIDMEYWVRLLAVGDLHYLAEPLCSFRVSTASWSFNLLKDQSRQFADLIGKTAAVREYGLSRLDVLTGRGLSTIYRWMRWGFYRLHLTPR